MSNGINLALVGASGVVGGKIISLFEKKNLNINNFYPLGSIFRIKGNFWRG